MSFTLLCHGPDHVEIGTDDGYRFVFSIASSVKGRRLTVGDTHWSRGVQPQHSFHVLLHAYRYASACAQDYGLR